MRSGTVVRPPSTASGGGAADTTADPATHDRRSAARYLLTCGVVGPPLFVLVVLAEGATRSGYSPWRHAISLLSLGEHGWMNIVALVAFGLLMLAFAWGAARVLRPGGELRWVPRLLTVFGLSLVVAGLFPIDPSLGYPPASERAYTLHGLVHDVSGLFLFGSLSASCLVLARRAAGRPGWARWAPYSLITGIMVLVFFIACSVAVALDQSGALSPAPGGLLQRVSIFSGLLWITLLAVRLRRGSGLTP